MQESPFYDFLPLRCGSAVACSLMGKDYEKCKEVGGGDVGLMSLID